MSRPASDARTPAVGSEITKNKSPKAYNARLVRVTTAALMRCAQHVLGEGRCGSPADLAHVFREHYETARLEARNCVLDQKDLASLPGL